MGVTRKSTRRSVERFETTQPGAVEIAGSRHTCTVRNLSKSGTLLNGDFDAQAGDRLDLEVAWIGRIPGQVAWRNGSSFGVVFTGQSTENANLARTLTDLELPCVADRRTPSTA